MLLALAITRLVMTAPAAIARATITPIQTSWAGISPRSPLGAELRDAGGHPVADRVQGHDHCCFPSPVGGAWGGIGVPGSNAGFDCRVRVRS